MEDSRDRTEAAAKLPSFRSDGAPRLRRIRCCCSWMEAAVSVTSVTVTSRLDQPGSYEVSSVIRLFFRRQEGGRTAGGGRRHQTPDTRPEASVSRRPKVHDFGCLLTEFRDGKWHLTADGSEYPEYFPRDFQKPRVEALALDLHSRLLWKPHDAGCYKVRESCTQYAWPVVLFRHALGCFCLIDARYHKWPQLLTRGHLSRPSHGYRLVETLSISEFEFPSSSFRSFEFSNLRIQITNFRGMTDTKRTTKNKQKSSTIAQEPALFILAQCSPPSHCIPVRFLTNTRRSIFIHATPPYSLTILRQSTGTTT